MYLKKIFFVIVIFVFLISSVNPLIIKLDKDELDENYFKLKYGEDVDIKFEAGRLTEDELDEIKDIIKNNMSIINRMEKKEKESILKIYNLEFVPKKMIIINIDTKSYIDPNGLKLKIDVFNGNNKKININKLFFNYEYTVTVDVYGVSGKDKGFTYLWIIEFDKELIKKNFNNDELPLKMIVEFPNGKKMIYNIKL